MSKVRCLCCGEVITGSRAAKTGTCSPRCRKRFSYVYRIDYGNCGICDRLVTVHDKMVAALHDGRNIYCSDTCRAVATARSNRATWLRNYERAKGYARKHSALRRARLRGVEVESFTHEQVFERDKWRCHICRKRIDPKLRKPAPGAAELDHLVPLSLGGAHTLANVAASHALCNKKKQARALGEQLRLVG